MVVALGTTTFEVLLVRSALIAVAVAAVWVAAVLTAIAVETLTQGRVRLALALGCPTGCHRMLLRLAAAVLTTTTLAPAAASAQTTLDGLALPDRPVGERARAQPPPEVSAVVRVRAGQSLWEISAQRLPPDASPHRIAALTRSLYQTNRAVIGDDPDLIHPGQSLIVPPTDRETYSEDS